MKTRLLLLMIVASLLAACTPLAKSELGRARDRWQKAGLTHYRYNLVVGCFCPFQDKMPLKIEVRDGQLVSMLYQDGAPVTADDLKMFSEYQTVDALFDFTSGALDRADEVHVEYDPTYGVPSTVQIDYIKNAVDDELSLYASNFEPLP